MNCNTLAWAPPGTDPLVDGMWTDRKCLFVDLLRWDVDVVEGRYEIDRFDGIDARYLVAIDAKGDHAGSLRLLPTTQPHILGDLFGCLCDAPVPRGADIFEITRLCLPVRFCATERLYIRNCLISAMVDHALAHDMAMLTAVVTADFREKVLAMGWQAVPLGPARRIGSARLGAFAIAVDSDTPALLAANGIYRRSPLSAQAHQAEIAA